MIYYSQSIGQVTEETKETIGKIIDLDPSPSDLWTILERLLWATSQPRDAKFSTQDKTSFPGCKLQTFNKMNSYLPYSRGGVGGDTELRDEERLVEKEDQAQLMLSTSISIASTLGINLKPGVSTQGRGDCIIEACVDQFLQSDFEELTEKEKEPQYWRLKVADMVENNITAYSMYRMVKGKTKGSKQQQWTCDWAQLRKCGQFQCQAGDLMAPGLATVLHKNILVFNTHPDTTSPITIHLAATLGGSVTTETPIILCYNGYHYEGLLPVSSVDKKRTTELVRENSPRKPIRPLTVNCPIPGSDYMDSNIRTYFPGTNTSSIKCSIPVKKSPKVDANTSVLGYMPQIISNSKTYPYPSQLHLVNSRGRNLCFSNSVVQLLHHTRLKAFLLSELPIQPKPEISVAQELARLYRMEQNVDSTENLCRYIFKIYSLNYIYIIKILDGAP